MKLFRFCGLHRMMRTICATVAGFIPARREASIDPMQALRMD
ncbi:hypothetical protein EDE15_4249 [Edaphobacter aggregans]|uniref:Uncharacterized protein n=1 Tax=Edaphobacter aggregans TaxID=570835 RepID=A0A3R9NWU2_9BACT|nr:hypothetical protein EDE15_4249 [Edaphobacter aggregans]